PSSFSHQDALAFFREQWPSLDEPSLRRLIGNALVQGEDADARSGLYSNRYDRRLADITTKAAIPEIDYLWESLTRIQCPTLVVRGDHSPILDDEISGRMVDSLPDGRLYVLKDTGHSLPRLRPEEFAGVLRRFLLGQPL
ncbi:MAG: alpha/beta hydrolase, partial [Nitrospirales bacterium]